MRDEQSQCSPELSNSDGIETKRVQFGIDSNLVEFIRDLRAASGAERRGFKLDAGDDTGMAGCAI